jgi:hypothetical protein
MKTSRILSIVNFRHYIRFTLLWGDMKILIHLYVFRQKEKYFELLIKSNALKSSVTPTYRHIKETALKVVEIPNKLRQMRRGP